MSFNSHVPNRRHLVPPMSYRPQTVASWYPPYQLSDSIHTMSWFGTPHFAMQILGARFRVQTHACHCGGVQRQQSQEQILHPFRAGVTTGKVDLKDSNIRIMFQRVKYCTCSQCATTAEGQCLLPLTDAGVSLAVAHRPVRSTAWQGPPRGEAH
jgi:hypothetical protein